MVAMVKMIMMMMVLVVVIKTEGKSEAKRHNEREGARSGVDLNRAVDNLERVEVVSRHSSHHFFPHRANLEED